MDCSDILIMTPEREQARRVADALVARGIATHVPVKFNDGCRESTNAPREKDPRDLPFFQRGKVTVSTIKSAKGYTAHVCHVALVHSLDGDGEQKERHQQSHSQLHVACTRSSLVPRAMGPSLPIDERSRGRPCRSSVLS